MEQYARKDVPFIDYTYFEDDGTKREKAKQRFIDNEVYVPPYDYPKLNHLWDQPESPKQRSLSEKKAEIAESILELEANKFSGAMPPELCDMYADFFEMRLKRILLVEAAERLRTSGSSSEREIARYEFMSLNRELYGEMDKPMFDTVMAQQAELVESFQPKNDMAAKIQSELLDYFRQHKFEAHPDVGFELSDEELQSLKSELYERFAKSLAEIPDTPDDVYYDATQCREILQRCLDAEGLGEQGWKCVVDEKKSNPSTNTEKQLINLPANTRRNAKELRRLWLHEGGVHAMRGANGKKTGIVPLARGTASYADVEEGLGVMFECVESGGITDSPAFVRARDRYIVAGLALGTDGVAKDGRQVYELMWRLLALRGAKDGAVDDALVVSAKNGATIHDENAFRGTNFANVGIIYCKLKVYLEGLMKNVTYYRHNSHRVHEATDDAMIGKSNHTDEYELSQVKGITRAA